MREVRVRKKALSDTAGDDFVAGSFAYRIGLVWPLTKELCSLSKRFDAKRRLQRHITRLSRRRR